MLDEEFPEVVDRQQHGVVAAGPIAELSAAEAGCDDDGVVGLVLFAVLVDGVPVDLRADCTPAGALAVDDDPIAVPASEVGFEQHIGSAGLAQPRCTESETVERFGRLAFEFVGLLAVVARHAEPLDERRHRTGEQGRWPDRTRQR